MSSRRHFLIITSGAVVMPHSLGAAERDPTLLDHLVLGCSDLDQGMAFVEKHTGVRPAMGGVHPGRGTRNALLALGVPYYLEVIAPDPQQHEIQPAGVPLLNALKQLAAPQLIDCAVHTLNIEAVAEQLRQAGMAFQGPRPGSRARPDGRVLHWKTLTLDQNHDGLLPFFIEWGADKDHPSVDAPTGCLLDSFAVAAPNPGEIASEFQCLGIDVPIQRGEKPQLRARIEGPGGELELGAA